MSLFLFEAGKLRGCSVAVALDAPPPERFAAEDLHRYLAEATGGAFPIVEELGDKTGFLVGAVGRPLIEPLPKLSEDGYVMKRVGSQIVLLGGSPRATLYAVYHFLEKYLDCRWLEPADDAVPLHSQITIGEVDDLEEPVYTYRSIYDFPYSAHRNRVEIDWAAKNRLNWTHPCLNDPHNWDISRGAETVTPEAVKRGLHIIWGGHTFQTWIPTEEYFATNPEFFGLIDGKRVPQQNDRGSICLSNKALHREVAKNMLAFAERNPDIEIVDIWMNDTADWCECEECEWMEGVSDYVKYPEAFNVEGKPQKSRAYYAFVNAVARLVATGNPILRLSPIAYARSFEPPAELELEPNVLLAFANFTRSRIDSLLDPHNATNVAYVDTINRWRARTKNMYIDEYVGYPDTFNPFSEFLYTVKLLAEEYKYYPTVGIRRMSTESAGEFYWRPLHMYAYAHLLWDPSLGAEEIIADFCRHAYGDVAEQMIAFWNYQEEREPFITRRDRSLAMLKEIKARTNDNRVLQRLAHLETLLLATDRITKWPTEVGVGSKDEGHQGLGPVL